MGSTVKRKPDNKNQISFGVVKRNRTAYDYTQISQALRANTSDILPHVLSCEDSNSSDIIVNSDIKTNFKINLDKKTSETMSLKSDLEVNEEQRTESKFKNLPRIRSCSENFTLLGLGPYSPLQFGYRVHQSDTGQSFLSLPGNPVGRSTSFCSHTPSQDTQLLNRAAEIETAYRAGFLHSLFEKHFLETTSASQLPPTPHCSATCSTPERHRTGQVPPSATTEQQPESTCQATTSAVSTSLQLQSNRDVKIEKDESHFGSALYLPPSGKP